MSTRVGPYDVTGTPGQVADIQAAVARCAYDLNGIGRVIPVKFSDLSPQGALGLFWTNGRIEIEQTLSGDEAQSVFLSESAHAVDQYVLTNADRIALQVVAHPEGPDGHSWFDNSSYYDELGETMMDVFVLAFTDLQPSGLRWTHPATPELVTALRGILTPAVVPPAPPVEPPPTDTATYVGCRWSRVFHRAGAHRLQCTAYRWPTRDAALGAGRRPCKRCNP